MDAFRRLDHLLCRVNDVREALEVFHGNLGFPVAWPIGRYWPASQACGIALGGINLELIQRDEGGPESAVIDAIAFEPTGDLPAVLENHGIPFEVSQKVESDPTLLELRSLPQGAGPQLLCTNLLPDGAFLRFPFFACTYVPALQRRLGPDALRPSDGNEVREVVVGHPDPDALLTQLKDLGIEGGVPITAEHHPSIEVIRIRMKFGPLPLGPLAARFQFTA